MHMYGARAVYEDRKGQSGLFVTMGRGEIINVSKKLGFLTVISSETEVMHNGESFPKVAWFRFFRLAQDDDDKKDLLFQDNKSYMQLHNNFPFSICKGIKHANVRCFFVVDRIEKKDFKLACCPNENMIVDYSTKPTKVSLFMC